MGKKKKDQPEPELGDVFGMAMALAAMRGHGRNIVRDPTAKTFAEKNDALVRDAEKHPFMGTVRRVQATRSLCACDARDEVLVGATNAARWTKAQQVAADAGIAPVRTVVIYTLNGHEGHLAPAELDVEDAKRLVNALSEAIAETEALTVEVN